jgi:hypothetical protein
MSVPQQNQNKDLYYFAFGSNMNSKVLSERRKVYPKASISATIPGYYLNFDTEAMPYFGKSSNCDY